MMWLPLAMMRDAGAVQPGADRRDVGFLARALIS
jgi:hypothetical protein